jgi:hypothetical protein
MIVARGFFKAPHLLASLALIMRMARPVSSGDG